MDTFSIDVERLVAGYRSLDDLMEMDLENQLERPTHINYDPQTRTYSLHGLKHEYHYDNLTLDDLLERTHPNYREKCRKDLETLNDRNGLGLRACTVIKPKGIDEYRILLVTLTAVLSKDGVIERYAGFISDISLFIQEKQRMDQLKRRSTIMREEFNISMWTYDPNTRTIYSDNFLSDDDFYHEYSEEQFLQLMHPDSLDAVTRLFEAMRQKKPDVEKIEACVFTPNNSYHFFDAIPTILKDAQGHVLRYVFTCRDTTEEKKELFRIQTFAQHAHQIMKNTGVRIYYYVPGSRFLQNDDIYCEERIKSIPIERFVQLLPENRRTYISHIFAQCDARTMKRTELNELWKLPDDQELRSYKILIIPVYNSKDELVEYGFMCIDVTEVAARERMVRFLENVGKIGAWTYDLNTRKSRMTEEACKIVGIDYKANKKLPDFEEFWSHVAPDEQSYFKDTIFRLLNDKHRKEETLYFHHKGEDGRERVFEQHVKIMRDKDGTPYDSYGTIMDVTERMRLIEERRDAFELLSTVLSNIPVSVFIKDIENDYTTVNANTLYAEYFHKPLSRIIGHRLRDYCPKGLLKALEEKDRKAARHDIKHPFQELDRIIDRNGQVRCFQNTQFAYSINGKKMLVGVSTDVTELQKAKEKAEKNDRLKSSFLANMSHEIRTPLNAIVGFSDLIANNVSPEENDEFCSIIHNSSDHLLRLISDILDMSKLEANSMKFFFNDFNLHAMMKEAYQAMKEKYSDKENVKLIYEAVSEPLTVHQDRVRVLEVLNNFLSNSYKHTDEGTVTIWVDTTHDRFRICVKDTGCGIPKEQQKSIFNRFEMAEGNMKEGTGLGLAICKAICEVQGGSIGVESEVGEGSLFWAEFPIEGKVIQRV